MNIIESIIIGIVEGITEFLPISSTGHMILANYLLHISQSEVVKAFEVFIQLGAILAVVVLYHKRFACLFDFKAKSGFKGLRGILMLIVTSLPILILGKLTEHAIKEHLFNPVVVTAALGIGGIILILIERIRFRHEVDSIDKLNFKDAFFIGLFQCFALCPGVSRAASTIIGGLFNGLKRSTAAEYSFLAAVPVMCIVCVKDFLEIYHSLSRSDLDIFAVGFVVAFVSALLAVKGFIRLLQHTSLAPFGVYRIIVAIIFFFLLRGEVLPH